MVKIRLRRRGRKRVPIYDIVAADSRSPRDGRYIERLGQYNPLITSGATMLDRERVAYWLRTGAQPSDTVRDILSREGVMLQMHMEAKGASSDEITSAVEAHVLQVKSREEKGNAAKKSAAPVAEEVVEEAAPAAEEAPAEETPAAPAEEAAAEAPAEEALAAEEAPAAEAPAEEAPAAEAPAEETPAEEAPAAEAAAEEAGDAEKS